MTAVGIAGSFGHIDRYTIVRKATFCGGGRSRARQGDSLYARTITECKFTDGSYSLWNNKIRTEVLVIHECIIAYSLQFGREGAAGETGRIVECAISDGGSLLGQVDSSEAGTIGESPVRKFSDAIGDGDLGEAGAAVKDSDSHRFQIPFSRTLPL